MNHSVYITDDAASDLQALFLYIESNDSTTSANYVLDEISKAFESLNKNPERGRIPTELQYLGISDFREIFFKPYRIIYRIINNDVYVMVIIDGRRDLQTLLQNRLLKPV